MSLEELKSQDAQSLPIGKLILIIAKNYSIYFNHHLEDFGINATQFHFLYEISSQKQTNQEKIASSCSFDKGAVARSIRKLEEKGLIKREIDENNRRQNKISMTPEGERTLNLAKENLHEWEDYVFKHSIVEKETLQELFKEISVKSIEFNQREN